MEQWKAINGFSYILVSSHGHVKNTQTGNYIGNKTHNGYMRINIQGNNFYIHRLVALAFIPNPMPFTYTVIDHIDEVRTNNHVSNLRWFQHWQNVLRSSITKGYESRKSLTYVPRIQIEGTAICFPTVETKEQARRIYVEARKRALCID